MTDPTNRRRYPRYKISPIVRIILPEGETIPGTMQDVSQGGMLVALSVELELERTYQIEVPDSQGVFCLLGEALRLHLPPARLTGARSRGSGSGSNLLGSMRRRKSG